MPLLSSLQLLGGINAEHVTANPVQGTKEWHQSVTSDSRNCHVYDIVKAISPATNQQAMFDESLETLITYAKKVESDMYKMADSKCEYFYLMGEKMYMIQKELREKRQRRKQQQLAQQQQSSQLCGVHVGPSPRSQSSMSTTPTGDIASQERAPLDASINLCIKSTNN